MKLLNGKAPVHHKNLYQPEHLLLLFGLWWFETLAKTDKSFSVVPKHCKYGNVIKIQPFSQWRETAAVKGTCHLLYKQEMTIIQCVEGPLTRGMCSSGWQEQLRLSFENIFTFSMMVSNVSLRAVFFLLRLSVACGDLLLFHREEFCYCEKAFIGWLFGIGSK